MVLRLVHSNDYVRSRKLRPIHREFREPELFGKELPVTSQS